MSEPEKDEAIRLILEIAGGEHLRLIGLLQAGEGWGKAMGASYVIPNNVEVPESAKHFDEPVPFREGYDIKDVKVHGMTGGGTCERVRPCKEETWRDRPPML